MTAVWLFNRTRKDRRSGRLVFLIECLLNQNARDMGAAENPAVTREVMDLLADNGIGMVQIPCPEMACLGFERRRPAGQTIRQALEAPGPATCCRELAAATADRIQSYPDQGFEVLAILGGNEESPSCAVHITENRETELAARSGVFMLTLAAELERRGLRIQFRGIRDANSQLLNEDIDWLRDRIS